MRFAPAALVAIATAIAPAAPAGAQTGLPFPPKALLAPATATRILGRWQGIAAFRAESTTVAVRFERAGGDSVRGRIWFPALNLYGSDMGPLDGPDANVIARPTGMLLAITPGDSLNGTIFGNAIVARMARSPEGTHAFDDPAPLPDTTAPGARARLPKVGWRYDAKAALWGSPVVADGVVYVGDAQGRVHAVSLATGRARWTFDAGGGVFGDCAVAGDAVYVEADPGVLYRLDRATGKPRWKAALGAPMGKRSLPSLSANDWNDLGPTPLVLGDMVYVGAADSVFRALDAATGEERWRFATHGDIRGAACADAHNVYFGGMDHVVHALDRATGKEAWSFDAQSPVTHGPMVAGGRVVVGMRDFSLLYSLDAATGKRRWSRNYWGSWVESTACEVDGTLYIGASDGQRVRALDPVTGRSRWEAWVGGWTVGTPVVVGDTVYYATGGGDGYFIPGHGSLGALDRATGAIRWRIPVADSATQWPTGYLNSLAWANGTLLAAGLDGALTAYRPATGAR